MMGQETWFIIAVALTVLVDRWRAPRATIGDGDTLEIQYFGSTYQFRLYGCDAPESDQPYGAESKMILESLLLGKPLKVKPIGIDKYGKRIVARVWVNGRCVSEQMIKRGAAWWYRAYAPNDRRLAYYEARAMAKKRGLWANSSPVPPWEWRKGVRNVRRDDS